ncbi:MAG: tRNA 2-thiouridine(34) synthase MnmA [Armatimonadota bacterium]
MECCTLTDWSQFRLECEPPNGQSVVVALSGGIDSAVAACLLKQQGYAVIGVMLKFWSESALDSDSPADNRCCTESAVDDARSLCQALNVPFYLINSEEPFLEKVVRPFVASYLNSTTPSPCLRCNALVRFPKLLQVKEALQADYLASGHYVRLETYDSCIHMLRAVDTSKDQSYMLYGLNQAQLKSIRFPLGTWKKADVRHWASEHGIPISRKPDSQELCFISDGDYRRFLRRQTGVQTSSGPIKHIDGRILGEHEGLWNYTIGQRRGLGVADGEALFVVAKYPETNTLVLGPDGPSPVTSCRLTDINWIGGAPPHDSEQLKACARYHGRMFEVSVAGDMVKFHHPAALVVPGQGMVIYQGDECLGGGVIAKTCSSGS